MVKIRITEKLEGVGLYSCVDEWRGEVVGAGGKWKKGDKVGGLAHLLAFAIDPEGYCSPDRCCKRAHVGDVVKPVEPPAMVEADVMDLWLEQKGDPYERITGPWATI